MFGRKLKWYALFESREKLLEVFQTNPCVLYRTMFGNVLLVRKENEFFAFKPKCPHQNKSLEGCSIKEDKLVCPWHQYAFSLKNGRGHGMYLEQYILRIDEKGVFIGKESWSIF
jgi:nitrite reductase/ring-hydroxylating ferredoxin subunit